MSIRERRLGGPTLACHPGLAKGLLFLLSIFSLGGQKERFSRSCLVFRAASLAFIAGRGEASQGKALSQRKKQYLWMLRPYVRNKQMALSYEKETCGHDPSRGLETGESRLLAWSPGQPAWRLLLVGAKHPREDVPPIRYADYGCFAPTIRRRTEPAGRAML